MNKRLWCGLIACCMFKPPIAVCSLLCGFGACVVFVACCVVWWTSVLCSLVACYEVWFLVVWFAVVGRVLVAWCVVWLLVVWFVGCCVVWLLVV